MSAQYLVEIAPEAYLRQLHRKHRYQNAKHRRELVAMRADALPSDCYRKLKRKLKCKRKRIGYYAFKVKGQKCRKLLDDLRQIAIPS